MGILKPYNNFTCLYQVGGSLQANSEVYITRKADSELYKYLCQGYFSYVLNCRQVGKSSLRIRAINRLEKEGVKCVSIDMSLVVSHDITLEQWYASFTCLVASELELYKHLNIRQWWSSHQHLLAHERLKLFFQQVVLAIIHDKVIIFLDEIDSIRNVDFSLAEFFQVIGSFYEERERDKNLNRLNFSVFGVATPEQLIRETCLNPFIKGYWVDLEGFKLQEVSPLIDNLPPPIKGRSEILKRALKWTSGQPFLTQKICYLIYYSPVELLTSKKMIWLDKLVRESMIINWQEKDNPEHLKTVSDRILYNPLSPANLLQLYRNIRQEGQVCFTDTPEERELILSGLIVNRAGKLKVKNLIYEQIFDDSWIERHLRRFQA